MAFENGCKGQLRVRGSRFGTEISRSEREEYRQALHAVWNSWRSQLALFKTNCLSLKLSRSKFWTPFKLAMLRILDPTGLHRAELRVWSPVLIAEDNVAYRDLVLLSQWIERYGFVEERIGVSILEMKQEWQANLIPQLSRAAELWDRIRTTNFETLDTPIDLVVELVKVHRLLTEFFVRWLGDKRLDDHSGDRTSEHSLRSSAHADPSD